MIERYRRRLSQFWHRLGRQFKAKPGLQHVFAAGYILIVVVYLLSATRVTLAAGSWTQTDWSGGSGNSTVNQYNAADSVDTANTGQISLTKAEKLSNGNLNADNSGWTNDSLQMTPAFVQSKAVRISPAATTITTTLNGTPTTGNRLIAVLNASSNPGAVTAPGGFTKDAEAGTSGRPYSYIYSKLVAPSEPSAVTFSYENTLASQLDVYEFSGLAPDNVVDRVVTATSASASTTSLSIGTTLETTQSNQVALAIAGFNGNVGGGSPAWDNDFIVGSIAGISGQIQSTSHKILSSKQTVSASLTWSVTRGASGILITYKAAIPLSATHESNTTQSGGGSARLTTTSQGAGAFTQQLTAGDTEDYNLETYAYTNGGSVTSADISLAVDGSSIDTSYSSAGGGWYKLTAVVAGSVSQKSYGVRVAANKTVYVDEFSLHKYASTGSLQSAIYDTGTPSNWGELTYSATGSTVSVKVRSSNSASMTNAPSFATCATITSGSDISTSNGGCVTDTERYIQYEVSLSTNSTASTAVFQDITIDFTDADATPPTINASNLQMFIDSSAQQEIAEESWSNTPNPFFSWTAGQDNNGGIGLKGYCLYLGSDDSANPVTTKGLLGTSPVTTNGDCQFIVAGTSLDLSTINLLATPLATSNNLYYLHIKAIDQVGNVFGGSSASFAFKYDNTPPTNPAYITAPSNFISTKTATLSWPTGTGDAASDTNSGLVGLQYRIGANGTWYGDDHSGSQDISDLLANDGSYTTQSTPDFANLVDGNNVIYFRTWDTAGNVTQATVTTVLKINTAGAPSSPRNINATPSANTQNSFAFSWIAPSNFVGQAGNLTYCYTINTQPTAQNCSFTAAGTTSIAAGAFATQPGTNTFYVVAKDESGGINYATAASVDFTANTAAPGMPLSLDIADTSVKATNNWRLVISWEQPTDTGAGVAKYQIFRSTDNNNFTLAGSTSGTSYVDTGLNSQLYYYKIKACDSANNCGAFSSTESKTPTGRFTSAPALDGSPQLESAGTKKATISWKTDRRADSKIAFGISSGSYFSTESYNSQQVQNHEIELNNLSPGTTYFYVTKWTDEDGNTGQSNEQTFVTLPAPVVEDVTAPIVTLRSASLQYSTLGASAVRIYYGKSGGFGGVIDLNTSTNRSTYTSNLSELDDGTKYFFKINTFDTDGNEYDGTTLTFTTPQAPRITNLQFQPIENEPSSSQKVSWDTNVPSSSEITYGITGLTESSVNSSLVTKHELIIRGLTDNSQYRLRAQSRDAAGNLATSDEQVFKTALDTRPPVISDVVVDSSIRGTGAEARGQIVVSWRTDEPATSQVAYGEGAGGFLSSATTEDTRLSYEHVVVVSDLSTSRVYHIEPRSFDIGRNQSSGEQQVAIVGRGSDNVLSIIFNALQQLFGIN